LPGMFASLIIKESHQLGGSFNFDFSSS